MAAQTALVQVDCQNVTGDLRHIWRSIGFDEINWSYTERGKDLLKTLKEEVIQTSYYVRNHNAFTSGNCLSSPASGSTNIYIEDDKGNPIYNFDIIDQIYDSYIENNFIPLIELGFMPYDLVPSQYQSDYILTGWKYPPKDYNKWQNLVAAFANHLYQRYGQQVENWYFEVWNEPNITNYWLGTVDDYCKLYDYAAEGLKSVNPNLKIGGPALATTGASENFLNHFLQHITNGTNNANYQIGTKIDFISFHTKGAGYNPQRSYGHKVPFEHPSLTKMLTDITNNLNIIYKYPMLNDLSVIVDECDPAVGTIYGVYDNPNFIVCNTEYYPSMVAAIIYNILLLSPRIKLITHWAFYFEGKRFFEGNRSLVTNYNLHLPILNGLKLFEKLKTKRLSVGITGTNIPINGITTLDDDTSDIQLLLFSHVDDYTFQSTQNITILFHNIKSKYVLVRHYRIDANNNNIYTEWVKMGKPSYLNDNQLKYFQNVQQLKLFNEPVLYEIQNNQLILDSLTISAHSVDFFELVNVD